MKVWLMFFALAALVAGFASLDCGDCNIACRSGAIHMVMAPPPEPPRTEPAKDDGSKKKSPAPSPDKPQPPLNSSGSTSA